jgi:hypothetical protein
VLLASWWGGLPYSLSSLFLGSVYFSGYRLKIRLSLKFRLAQSIFQPKFRLDRLHFMEVSWNFCKTSTKLPQHFHGTWKFCGSFVKLPQNFHETSMVYGSFVELFQNFHKTSMKLPSPMEVSWKFYKTSTTLLQQIHGGIDFLLKTNTKVLNIDIS